MSVTGSETDGTSATSTDCGCTGLTSGDCSAPAEGDARDWVASGARAWITSGARDWITSGARDSIASGARAWMASGARGSIVSDTLPAGELRVPDPCLGGSESNPTHTASTAAKGSIARPGATKDDRAVGDLLLTAPGTLPSSSSSGDRSRSAVSNEVVLAGAREAVPICIVWSTIDLLVPLSSHSDVLSTAAAIHLLPYHRKLAAAKPARRPEHSPPRFLKLSVERQSPPSVERCCWLLGFPSLTSTATEQRCLMPSPALSRRHAL
jgi:hypothetical protein